MIGNVNLTAGVAGASHRLACSVALVLAILPAAPALSQSRNVPGTLAIVTHQTERNREIVRHVFETWANGRSIFDDILADDVVWTIHGSDPVAGTYYGKQDFVKRASEPLVSRLQSPIVPVVHAIWAEGDTVIVRFDGSATTTSGSPYRNQFVWIFQMPAGVVTRAEAFLDLAAYRDVINANAPKGIR